jgi:hypothetical protein
MGGAAKMSRLEEEQLRLVEGLGGRAGADGLSPVQGGVEGLRAELAGAQAAAARGQEEVRSLRGQLRAQEEEAEQKLGVRLQSYTVSIADSYVSAWVLSVVSHWFIATVQGDNERDANVEQ